MKNARTGENMLVTAIAGANTVTLKRAIGSVIATAGLSGDGLFIVGNANEENGGARNVNTTVTNPETNYTQIFKTTIALSDTEKEANLYGGKD